MTDDRAARVFVALGSNLGDRREMIRRALALMDVLPGTRVIRASDVVETAPLTHDAAGAPGTQPDYLNAVCELSTTLAARELLDALLSVERELGRVRLAGERWGARTIDLDIVLYGDRVIDEPGLTIPHPEMHKRDFVLGPLVTIAPGVVHPRLGRTIAELAAKR